jgi:hypothetical protein
MLPTRKGRALLQALVPALVGVCLPLGLLPGCSPDRRPGDLTPALPSGHTTLETPRLPPVGDDSPPLPAGEGAVQVIFVPPPDGPSPPLPLSLPEAIQFGLQNNPRLRAALAAIERARGQQEAAFAPFLPQIDLLNRDVATGKSTLPGAPGPTGVVNVTGIGH